MSADGSYVLFVRSGSKAIEFEKGENAIAVPSFDKIPMVIEILITAVRNCGSRPETNVPAGPKVPSGMGSVEIGDEAPGQTFIFPVRLLPVIRAWHASLDGTVLGLNSRRKGPRGRRQ